MSLTRYAYIPMLNVSVLIVSALNVQALGVGGTHRTRQKEPPSQMFCRYYDIGVYITILTNALTNSTHCVMIHLCCLKENQSP